MGLGVKGKMEGTSHISLFFSVLAVTGDGFQMNIGWLRLPVKLSAPNNAPTAGSIGHNGAFKKDKESCIYGRTRKIGRLNNWNRTN